MLTTFDVLRPRLHEVAAGTAGVFTALLVPQPRFYEFKAKLPQGEHQF